MRRKVNNTWNRKEEEMCVKRVEDYQLFVAFSENVFHIYDQF